MIKLTDVKPNAFSADEISVANSPSLVTLKVGNSDTKISDTNDKISATNKMNAYKKEHYDLIRLDVPKGYKALLKEQAAMRGMSLRKMFLTAVVEYLQK